MLAWELKLRVRRQSCEFRLGFARERHGDIVLERNRCPVGGPARKKKDDKLALLRDRIRRELEEIRFIKQMANVGPIVGNKMVLHVRDGTTHKVRPGPSIIDLMQRKANEFIEEANEIVAKDTETHDHKTRLIAKAEGMELALEILYNPYRFLDKDERAAYDLAESNADKIIENRAGTPTGSQTILPAGQPAPSLASVRAMSAGPVVRRKKPDG